jgi:ribosomal-protein-alanine N-acetyltransferase
MSDAFEIPIPELFTPRLRLRALTTDDSTAVLAYASNPEVARYTLWKPISSEIIAKGFIKVLTQALFLNWAILRTDNNGLIGMIFLHSLNRNHNKAEIAFNLSQSHWKQGLATEAAWAVLDYAFKEIKLNRIEATCMPANAGSRRVLEKVGMSHEGRMQKSHRRYDGYHDMDLYAKVC